MDQALTDAPDLAPSTDEVPKRLIATAIELYGARGCQAVSNREIQRRAGVLNEAAVRYYFGNKAGLLDACLAGIAEQYGRIADAAWDELEALRDTRALRVQDIITALVMSFHALQQHDAHAVQLVARMIREEGGSGQDLLLRHFDRAIWRTESVLAELLPHKSARALRLHTFLAINSTVNGMVDQTLLSRLPDPHDAQQAFRLDGDALARGFIEYVAAGVSAASEL